MGWLASVEDGLRAIAADCDFEGGSLMEGHPLPRKLVARHELYQNYANNLKNGAEVSVWWPGRTVKGECNEVSGERGCWTKARLLNDTACLAKDRCLHVAYHDGENSHTYTCPTWVRALNPDGSTGATCKSPDGWQACPPKFTLLRLDSEVRAEFMVAKKNDCTTGASALEAVGQPQAQDAGVSSSAAVAGQHPAQDASTSSSSEALPGQPPVHDEGAALPPGLPAKQPPVHHASMPSAESPHADEGRAAEELPGTEAAAKAGQVGSPATLAAADGQPPDAQALNANKGVRKATAGSPDREEGNCIVGPNEFIDKKHSNLIFDVQDNQWYRCRNNLRCKKIFIRDIQFAGTAPVKVGEEPTIRDDADIDSREAGGAEDGAAAEHGTDVDAGTGAGAAGDGAEVEHGKDGGADAKAGGSPSKAAYSADGDSAGAEQGKHDSADGGVDAKAGGSLSKAVFSPDGDGAGAEQGKDDSADAKAGGPPSTVVDARDGGGAGAKHGEDGGARHGKDDAKAGGPHSKVVDAQLANEQCEKFWTCPEGDMRFLEMRGNAHKCSCRGAEQVFVVDPGESILSAEMPWQALALVVWAQSLGATPRRHHHGQHPGHLFL